MLVTVRLNDKLTECLTSMTKYFHKKKLEKNQTTHMQKAIKKTARSDMNEYKILEDTLNDGLSISIQ